MFTEEILKQKTNQDLRKICKDLKCAQYGDKATIIKRTGLTGAGAELGKRQTREVPRDALHRKII